MRHAFALTVAASAVLALAACGKSSGERLAEAAIEASTGQKAEVDADGGAVTFKTEQGEMKILSGDAARLPESFPKDVFLPAEYTVASAMEMPGALVIELDAPGQVNTLFATADKHMLAEGWKQRVSMQQTADTHVAIYEKENRSATLSLYDNDGKGVKVGVQVQQQAQ
jgi:hypothetical protein